MPGTSIRLIVNRALNVDWSSRHDPISDPHSDPGNQVAEAELVDAVYQQLTLHEQGLFARRRQGDDWNQIAEAEGESCAVLRQRLSCGVLEAYLWLIQ